MKKKMEKIKNDVERERKSESERVGKKEKWRERIENEKIR